MSNWVLWFDLDKSGKCRLGLEEENPPAMGVLLLVLLGVTWLGNNGLCKEVCCVGGVVVILLVAKWGLECIEGE